MTRLVFFSPVIKSAKATFTHIDVHFTRGGEKSYASLEEAAKNKRKEYEAAHSYFLKLVKKLRSADEPRSEEAEVLCKIERLLHSLRFLPTGESRPNVVTFGVSYDGAFTDEAMSFLARLAAIKYPETQGCLNYLVMRANWIDHWVKYIQAGLTNSLARGMVRSYTDLAAQHAVTRPDRLQTLSPPPVPQSIPRFTSRGIAHASQDAFPPYLQPNMTFIDGICSMETTTSGAGTASAAISSRSLRPRGRRGLSEIQRRSLLVTPPRRPINRPAPEPTDKETEEYGSGHDNPANSAETGSMPLVSLSDESGGEDYSFYSEDSMDQETSLSLIPNSQTRVSTSSIAESSQSLFSHSQEQEPWSTNHKVGDLVKILMRKRTDGSLVTSVGTVTHIRPDRRVKTDTCNNYFRPVLRTIMSMIPDDTQSQSAHSPSQVL